MSVALWVGSREFRVGSVSFLKALFSTIFIRLEGGAWGSEYPVVMRHLYAGTVPQEKAEAASEEIARIRKAFAACGPDQVVWDFEDRAARPPWGDDISTDITSLAEYFVTADGKDLLEVLDAAFEEAHRTQQDVEIQ